jgi:hypothetical protein
MSSKRWVYALGESPRPLEFRSVPRSNDIELAVSWDGRPVGTIVGCDRLVAGQEVKLPDGSTIGVRAAQKTRFGVSYGPYHVRATLDGELLSVVGAKRLKLLCIFSALVYVVTNAAVFLWPLVVVPALGVSDATRDLAFWALIPPLALGLLGLLVTAFLYSVRQPMAFAVLQLGIGCQTGPTRKWRTGSKFTGYIIHRQTPYVVTPFRFIYVDGQRAYLTVVCNNCGRGITVATGLFSGAKLRVTRNARNDAGYRHVVGAKSAGDFRII